MADIPYSSLPGASAHTQLREGVAILTAAGTKDLAKEIGGHGVFTNLLLKALAGGAADIRGYVSTASVYAYIEQALGPWDQRPLYKSYSTNLSPIRRCKPNVADDILRKLPAWFLEAEASYKLDPSYEISHKLAEPAHVEIFNKFKCLRDARLLRTVNGDDLYFAAMNSNDVELTQIGRLYWWRAKKNLL